MLRSAHASINKLSRLRAGQTITLVAVLGSTTQ